MNVNEAERRKTALLAPQPFVTNPREYMIDRIRRTIEHAQFHTDEKLENESLKANHTDTRSDNHADPNVIDISPWLDEDEGVRRNRSDLDGVASAVLRAALTTGSFRVTAGQQRISSSTSIERMERAAQEFFRSPALDKRGYRDYVALESESVDAMFHPGRGQDAPPIPRDLRETYVFNIPLPEDTSSGTCPPAFRDAIPGFALTLQRLDVVLHRILSRALALHKNISLANDFFDEVRGVIGGRLRCNWYPPVQSPQLEQTEGFASLRPHADIVTLTILYRSFPGLQELREGIWTDVPHTSPGEFHVMIGQMSHLASNGAFEPNIHRVVSHTAEGKMEENSDSPSNCRTSYTYFCVGGAPAAPFRPVVALGEPPMFGSIVGHEYVASILSPIIGADKTSSFSPRSAES